MWILDSLLDDAVAQLDLSARCNDLTVLVGNGLSQSAAYVASPGTSGKQSVGWWKAVADAAIEVGIDQDLNLDVSKDLAQVNPLAIMEAIERRAGRERLMTVFRSAFKEVLPCMTHELIVKLKPRHIVTTNYDDILEKAFPQARVLVRDFVTADDPDVTTIHKIHGTLAEDVAPDRRPVISETDYDECLQQLKDSYSSHRDSALWKALYGPLLVIGKGLYWHDLSFLYALRATRDRASQSFWICTHVSKDVLLHLDNVRVMPLHVRLPNDAENGHYYAGVGLALARLFREQETEAKFLRYIEDNNLVRAPVFVGIGIAAHNTVGYVGHPNSDEDSKLDEVIKGRRKKDFKVDFPSPGRRNRTFHSEEFPGGSALTALGVFSALATRRERGNTRQLRRSLISVINGQDPYSTTIRAFCGRDKLDIDTDGVANDGDQTWHSTVVLHDIVARRADHDSIEATVQAAPVNPTDGTSYDGVRFFFDRRVHRLSSGDDTAQQLRAQLDSPTLRLLYMDKFLAQSNDDGEGFLVKQMGAFEPLLNRSVDVLYETGGAGSPGAKVETAFAKYFSILSSSFPFFARYVLDPNERDLAGNDEFGDAMNGATKPWWNLDFLKEREVLERFLEGRRYDEIFPTPPHWNERARRFLRTDSKAPRRWCVVTLHERGALGFDVDKGLGMIIAPPGRDGIVNTSGAGDVFRGAFCYELVNHCTPRGAAPNDLDVLRKCIETGVECATKKCQTFSQGKFLNEISGQDLF